jgi:Uma2 family endonuclease
MAETVLERTFLYIEEHELPDPVDVSHLVTEDDTPVDNIFSERQMSLLSDSLYTSWNGPGEDRPFAALTNVALYYSPHEDALVPDALISLDVHLPAEGREKRHRSYFLWEYGKPPEVVVEIVSNRKGGELSHKLMKYARIGIVYYIVFDPFHHLSNKTLLVHTLKEGRYQESKKPLLPIVGLGVTLWHGVYKGMEATWLRWQDREGNLLLTGEERAEVAEERAGQAVLLAAQAQQQATVERQRAERLAAQLRALGIEPEQA